ncbi:IPT/TIG domain-containing protein [Sorangium atrum]|uniref:IPT/TIG domain-containing protein n=1 Tax=Sorangium atrum TaxID=2995308 RepID=A0ABT5BY12_9BACT|nr:IPT/TIG domain-containing protein [Sorangium aterium]MDC0679051.1 IPT/TIG domain-containing protein [Sorangium aterium]
MGNFSKSPLDVLKDNIDNGYVGLHVEQGVPVLDRDLNLLGDLIMARLRSVVGRYIGDGVPDAATTFNIAPVSPAAADDFMISAGGAGVFLAGGMEMSISASIRYKAQPGGVPALSTSGPRTDTIYLDTFTDEVGADPVIKLDNPDDVGMRTSVRRKPNWVVRVAEGVDVTTSPPGALPAAPFGHTYTPLALLARPAGGAAITAAMLKDLRRKNMSFALLEQRIQTLERLLAPVITSFTPQTVRPAQTSPITITGRNFQVGTPQVLLGDTQAIVDLAASTDTSLVVRPPLGTRPGTWPLKVRNDVGEVTALQNITVLALSAPSFVAAGTQITPKQQRVGNAITINGLNLSLVNKITFNAAAPVVAQPTDILGQNNSQIQVRIPDAVVPNLTAINVTLAIEGAVLADGSPVPLATTVDTVQVQPASAPFFNGFTGAGSQISPTSQRINNNVTLKGQNFGSGSPKPTVTFNASPTPVSAAPGDITVTAPDGAGQQTISVRVPVGLPTGAGVTVTVTVAGWSATSTEVLTVLPAV